MGLNKKNEYPLSEYLMNVRYMEETMVKDEDIETLYHFSETLAQQPYVSYRVLCFYTGHPSVFWSVHRTYHFVSV